MGFWRSVHKGHVNYGAYRHIFTGETLHHGAAVRAYSTMHKRDIQDDVRCVNNKYANYSGM